MSPAAKRLGHVPALDGLRGIAVLLVLLSHLSVVAPDGPTGVRVLDNPFRGGFLGVDLFFVLSGFLISALLLREESVRGTIRFAAFYGRRALRLLPALVTLLAVHVTYVLVAGEATREEWWTVSTVLLYCFNWLGVWRLELVNPDLGHLWSLSIEEQFYIFWPILLLFGLPNRRRALTVCSVLLAAIALVAVHRCLLWDRGVPWIMLFMRTDTRVDALLFGALLASLWVRGRTPSRGLPQAAWLSSAALLGIVAYADPTDSFCYRGGLSLAAALFAVLVLAVVDGNWLGARIIGTRPLRAIGRVSYGLYLWHLPVFHAFSRHANAWPSSLRVAAAVGTAMVLTLLSWYVVERPALRLKQRLSTLDTPRVS